MPLDNIWCSGDFCSSCGFWSPDEEAPSSWAGSRAGVSVTVLPNAGWIGSPSVPSPDLAELSSWLNFSFLYSPEVINWLSLAPIFLASLYYLVWIRCLTKCCFWTVCRSSFGCDSANYRVLGAGTVNLWSGNGDTDSTRDSRDRSVLL